MGQVISSQDTDDRGGPCTGEPAKGNRRDARCRSGLASTPRDVCVTINQTGDDSRALKIDLVLYKDVWHLRKRFAQPADLPSGNHEIPYPERRG